jgi:GDPmannose 4,6-dehydratase
LYLGNLNASRDWGHAKDYVNAIWLMLQSDKPKDYVIASGETHTVREFVQLAFAHAGVTIDFKGEGLNEVGYDVSTGKELVRVDPVYFRPSEVDFLLGDATRARKELGWTPQYSFKALVADMMDHDLKDARRQAQIKDVVFDLHPNEGVPQ